MGKRNNPQLERERAVYSYLDALDSGDIDGIIASLQQAVYDAPLDQMLDDAHQAYFQEEQSQQDELAEIEAQTTISMPVVPLKPRNVKLNQKQRRRAPMWLQTLAAVLIVGALIGSFAALLVAHNANNAGKRTSPVCYPLRQFDTQKNAPASDTYNRLSAVTIVSANDAWAVGNVYSSPGMHPVLTTFIEHWDGESWQVVPSPNSPDGNGLLSAVAALSANDVWAVGYSTHGTPPAQDAEPVDYSRTLIEHWDGKSWQIVPSPNAPTGNGELNSLTAISQNDIWAVGLFSNASHIGRPLLEHWDGKSWQQVVLAPSTITSTGANLTHITALSANDIWAVGVSFNPNLAGSKSSGLVLHWNGNQWQSEPAPPASLVLFSVSVLSAQDVWVTGFDKQGIPLVAHWDGQQWSSVALPDEISKGVPTLRDIQVVSTHDVWALATGGTSILTHIIILHWDGQRWQQMPVPALQAPSSGEISLSEAQALAISDGQMWIVGDGDPTSGGSVSIILGQRTCP